MYLSKVYIPWKAAANPYELHRELWKFFPDREDEKRHFLFRVEQLQAKQGAQILMQSDWQPEHGVDGCRLLACKEIHLGVQEGQRLRFRLRANVVKTIKDESKGSYEKKGKSFIRSRRQPIYDEAGQRGWLERKLNGFATLDALMVLQEAPLFFNKRRERRTGKVQPVLFDGVLQVQDESVFLTQLHQGIGPAKAFGMGLLSIAPA